MSYNVKRKKPKAKVAFSDIPSTSVFVQNELEENSCSESNTNHIDLLRKDKFTKKNLDDESTISLHNVNNYGNDGTAKDVEEVVYVKNDMQSEKDQLRVMLSTLRSIPKPLNERRNCRNEFLKSAGRHSNVTRIMDMNKYKMKEQFKTLAMNFLSYFEIWSGPLKTIEGHYGTGIVSFFIFLRWLLLMNIIMFLAQLIFIVAPQISHDINFIPPKSNDSTNLMSIVTSDSFAGNKFVNITALLNRHSLLNQQTNIASKPSLLLKSELSNNEIEELGSLFDTYADKGFLDSTLRYNKYVNYSQSHSLLLSKKCHEDYLQDIENSTDVSSSLTLVQQFFQGTGWMMNTLMFLGYYDTFSSFSGANASYNIAVASLGVLIFCFGVSIMLMLYIATKGVEESMLGHNLQETYCYLVICGWDFTVSEEAAAERRHRFIHYELASALDEERKALEHKNWSYFYRLRVYVIRCFVHLLSILFLIGSYFLLFYIAKSQRQLEKENLSTGLSSFINDFLPSFTVTLLNLLIPFVLKYLAQFECYQMRHEINITLIRVVLLREASMIILISSFYNQINCQPKDQCLKGTGECKSPLCWETYVGQQIYRLVILDLIVNLATVLLWETPRRLIVNKLKDRCSFLQLPIFDIPLQVLALIYSQTLCWLGLFFCPLLPAITVVKLVILFYIKKYTLFNNCTGAGIFKASRSNAIFAFVLMLTFLVSLVVVGYSVTKLTPSPGCSPYRYYSHITSAIRRSINNFAPQLNEGIAVILSPLFSIPLVIFLCLFIYYYLTKTAAHRKMVELLKIQLTLEGKDKQYLLTRVTRMKPNVALTLNKKRK